MTTYRIEVKSASTKDAQLGKWARAARVWVRGYDESGKRLFQHFVGFVDTRCKGPRSRYAAVYSHAERLLDTFQVREVV